MERKDIIDDPRILSSFYEEVRDQLQTWEREIISYEKNLNATNFDEIFRIAHNIKGSAKMLGMENISVYIHHLEDIIKSLTNREIKLSVEVVNLFFQAHLFLLKWVDELVKNAGYVPDDFSVEVSKLNGFKSKSSSLQIIEVQIDEDIVIKNLLNIRNKYEYKHDHKYQVLVGGNKIDTAGVQYLLALKKSILMEITIKIKDKNLLNTINLLGVEDFSV